MPPDFLTLKTRAINPNPSVRTPQPGRLRGYARCSGPRVGLALGTALLLVACGGRTASVWSERCDNGIDDDGDLLVDCDDPQCGDDPACTTATCGNGRIDPGEQCDQTELGGVTCADVVPESTGELACGPDCRYDTSDCQGSPFCGNGRLETGEECDCGQEPDRLPAGCSAPNGWQDSECANDCTWQSICGNGRLETGEECDDGNLEPGDGCSPLCQVEIACSGPTTWEECDPTQPEACCPDAWGAPLTCVDVSSTALCLRPCGSTSDCYWSHYCEASLGACWVAVCGGDIPGSPVNAPCQVPGGGAGWCAPLFERQSPEDPAYGICIESGGLTPGASCTPSDVLGADRSVPQCNQGWCAADPGQSQGRCLQFCAWEAEYAHAFAGGPPSPLPCPAGTNCLAQSYVDANHGGALQEGLSVCIDTRATDPVGGVDTCSLVTGALLADPSRTCADVQPNGRCFMITWQSNQPANGTLLGVCAPGPANPLGIWDPCTPGNDACPGGTVCAEQDAMSSSPNGPYRCVPYCDVARHSEPGDCAALGAPADARCTSFSAPYGLPPGTPVSPLGLCTLP